MRYHLYPNVFEKSIKIKKRKSPLYDRMLATVVHCTPYAKIFRRYLQLPFHHLNFNDFFLITFFILPEVDEQKMCKYN